MLSAVVLAKNVELSIAEVVGNLAFCDEVVVVDDNSTDNTALVAAKAGAVVLTHSLEGDFSAQRNYALEKTEGDWVLFVDTDETVPENLQKEIRQAIEAEKDVDAFYIKRRDIWWGRELQFGEVYDVAHKGLIRLMKKTAGHWSGKVHETFATTGKTARLTHHLTHRPHPGLKDFLNSINVYSTLRAKELFENKKKQSIISLVCVPPIKFFYTYVLKFGFLEGTPGFAYSFLMSFHSFLVRAKLYAKYV